MKPLILPDGFSDLSDSIWQPEIAPNAATMARFDADPYELQCACSEWLRMVEWLSGHPLTGLDEDYPEFESLTEALRLWASLHGLGDGMVLEDAAIAAYRGKNDTLRARLFLVGMQNRSKTGTPSPTDQPTGKPELLTVRQAAKLLQISTRTLWTLTKQRIIPYVPVGRSVRYNLDELRKWIEANQHGKHRQR
jgi:excisionase family DNA binding protein